MANPKGWKHVIEGSTVEVVADLGTDVILAVLRSGDPVNGTTGTLAGIAGPGSLLIAVNGKKLHINTNTKSSPTWTVVGTQT